MTDESIFRSHLLIAADPDEQAGLAASLLLAKARTMLIKQPWYNLIISGGNGPIPLFRHLASDCRDAIEWERVRFFWADERNVPPEHPESNFGMAEKELLGPLGIPKKNIFRIPTTGDSSGEGAARAAEEYERILRQLFPHSPDIDHALMGLGDDGHTASLFPDAWDEWKSADGRGKWVSSVWVPHLNAFRITLLPHLINQSMRVCFLVSGVKKAKILRAVIEQQSKYPAQLIHSRFGRSFWLVDQAAATLLGSEPSQAA